MYCPKCGLENPEDAKVCLSCSQLLPVEETPLQPQIPAKTSTLAIWSFVLALMGLFTLMITALPALICGIVGLVKIGNSEGRLKGKGLAIAGTVISFIGAIFLSLMILTLALAKMHSLAPRIMCSSNLSSLHQALMVYAADHNGVYPSADNWCDAIFKNYNVVNANQFCCPGSDAKVGQSSYAININVAGKKASEIPPDTVLLFETSPGVNPAGGPEILSTDNHRGNGCNVLFADGRVEFIKSEELSTLRWNPE